MAFSVDNSVDEFSRFSPQGELAPVTESGTTSRRNAELLIHI